MISQNDSDNYVVDSDIYVVDPDNYFVYVVPNMDASTNQLRELGFSILEWLISEVQERTGAVGNVPAIFQLIAGEWPKMHVHQDIISIPDTLTAKSKELTLAWNDSSVSTEELNNQLRWKQPMSIRSAREKWEDVENLDAVRLGYVPRNGMSDRILLNRICDIILTEYVSDILDCEGNSCWDINP